MRYSYLIYGLRVISEIELPKLYVWKGTVPSNQKKERIDNEDVVITVGEMELSVKQMLKQNHTTSLISKNKAILSYENEGTFLIENGSQIIVEMEVTHEPEHIRALIESNCLGLIMVQRGILAIHGGAMIHNHKSVIITGISGAGKSTLCLHLRSKGMGFLADDTVAISLNGDKVYTYPAYPYTKLCKDTAVRSGYHIDNLQLLNEDREKYAVNLSNDFCTEPVRPEAVVVLSAVECREVSIAEVTGSRKIQLLIDSLYSYQIYQVIGMDIKLFQKAIEIARQIPFYQIVRPKNKMTVQKQMELLMEQLGEEYKCGKK